MLAVGVRPMTSLSPPLGEWAEPLVRLLAGQRRWAVSRPNIVKCKKDGLGTRSWNWCTMRS